jgi:hypothetical protein
LTSAPPLAKSRELGSSGPLPRHAFERNRLCHVESWLHPSPISQISAIIDLPNRVNGLQGRLLCGQNRADLPDEPNPAADPTSTAARPHELNPSSVEAGGPSLSLKPADGADEKHCSTWRRSAARACALRQGSGGPACQSTRSFEERTHSWLHSGRSAHGQAPSRLCGGGRRSTGSISGNTALTRRGWGRR